MRVEDNWSASAGSIAEQRQSHYLAGVDGLRAVAILAVVGFHTGLPGFGSGYVGVDIFFVISGYLIINQIRNNIKAGKGSLLSFYARRVLRILPPYLLVLLVITAVAPFFLTTPTEYVDFFWSAIWSPLMVSSVFFYLRQGYFDIAAIQKPLLHTWTLSVEEQFYLVAPLLLLGIFHLGGRRFGKLALAIGMVLAALSLAGAITESTATGPNPAFYLAQWRAWEFIAGGLITPRVEMLAARLPRLAAEFIGTGALGAIALSITALKAGQAYPSYWATLPVAGATLTILGVSAHPRTLAARFLAHRFMVAIGLVSYAWYLWHWPILSFTRILRFGEPSLAVDLATGGLLAFVLACATYLYIEVPVRRWRKIDGLKRPSRIVARGVAACLAILIACAFVNLGGAFAVRSLVLYTYGANGKGVVNNGCMTSAAAVPARCFQQEYGLLIGDSQAGAFAGSFTRFFSKSDVQLITIWHGGCDPFLLVSNRVDEEDRVCGDLHLPFDQVVAMPKPPKFVIIASIWGYRKQVTVELLSKLMNKFDLSRTKILFVASIPVFEKGGANCVVLSDRYYSDRKNCDRPRAEAVRMAAPILAALKSVAERYPQVRYIDPTNLFCDPQTCRVYSGDTLFYGDGMHVRPAGADRILSGFEEDFRWLAEGQ